MSAHSRVASTIGSTTCSPCELPVEPPYRLVGWSFGGVVAVEAERRLIAGGTPVFFVGMIDTIRPNLRPLSTIEYVSLDIAGITSPGNPV